MKDMLKNIINKTYFKVAIINLVIFGIANILFNIKYEQVDDMIIYSLYSGLDSTYNIHGIYIYPLICLVLSNLYKICSIINWHTVLLLSMQFICFTVIGTILLKNKSSKVGYILYTIFASICYTSLLLLIQYTSVSALLIATAFFIIFDMQEEKSFSKRKKVFADILFVLGIMIIGIYIISSIIYYKKNIKVENLFLMIVPFTCIFFLITMPTFKNHDEYYHWLKAYEVSEGYLMTPNKDGVQGSLMPESVANVCPTDWTTMTYADVKEKLKHPLEKEKQAILNPETAAVYSFAQYVPQAVGIFLSRLVTDNTYLITYAGRIMNMIVSILLLYFAIKIMPFGKKLLLIPAMIPIAVEGFTSLSPDAMTISMSFLYIAYILYLAFGNKEKIGIKEKIILLVMSVIIALCKIVYIPLVGLLLIIPKEKFKTETNKNKILNICIIAVISVVINLIWLGIASRYLANFREGDSKVQVLLALKNPIQYIQTVLYTMNLNGSNYLMQLFGSDLGWGELVKLYAVVPYSILAIYLFIAVTDEEIKNKFKTYQLVWIALVVLAVVALVFTSLYVQWTTGGKESISGVQGRYFLPILPLVMLLLGSMIKVQTSYRKENINKFLAISTLVLQIYTISQIIVVHL